MLKTVCLTPKLAFKLHEKWILQTKVYGSGSLYCVKPVNNQVIMQLTESG